MSSHFIQRGGGWVVAQSLLMLASLLAPLGSRAAWSGGGWRVVGGLLIAVSAVFGLAGVAALGRNRTMFPAPRPDAELVQHGVYRMVRHPLYTSVMCFAPGWGLCWQSPAALIAAAAIFLLLHAKAEREEKWLLARFPEYEGYQQRTKRFLPGIF